MMYMFFRGNLIHGTFAGGNDLLALPRMVPTAMLPKKAVEAEDIRTSSLIGRWKVFLMEGEAVVEGAEEEDGVDVVEGGDFGKSPVLDLLGRRNAI